MLVLLAGQLAAQAHQYSHLRIAPELTDRATAESSFCNDCLAFAPLLSAGGAPDSLFVHPFEIAEGAIPVALTGLIALTLSLGFRSRAPPRLL